MRKQRAKSKAKRINTMCTIGSVLAGLLGVLVLKDATVLVVALMVAPVLFFRKHTYY